MHVHTNCFGSFIFLCSINFVATYHLFLCPLMKLKLLVRVMRYFFLAYIQIETKR
jgi:hypothetical protein